MSKTSKAGINIQSDLERAHQENEILQARLAASEREIKRLHDVCNAYAETGRELAFDLFIARRDTKLLNIQAPLVPGQRV